jgi:asparagine synthase (glutamine-hydrolysing)
MCGICGILNLDGSPISDSDRQLIGRMTSALAHRGPDDSGTYIDGPVALGNRRLAVIDLSDRGRQPMSTADGVKTITYNGEVYNFSELKQAHRLAAKGHEFRSGTDTEVLLHLFREIGTEMASELNGMFAVALWDARQQTLHLIRDRYGIKPLFYTRQGNRLLFASEIASLLEDSSVVRRVNSQALHDYLTFNYVPGEQTMFEGIYEVPPAHRMAISTSEENGGDIAGRIDRQRYWDLSFENPCTLSVAEIVVRTEELMEKAVQRRLIADIPVGVLLSGGLDSSSLVALMHGLQHNPIHTFSVGFKESDFNELPYARIVANHFGTVHHEVTVTASTVRELLHEQVRRIQEPYGDGSAIPTYCVCRMAREEVGVVLSGEGGDEAFAGYETHSAYKVSRWFRRVPRWIRNGLIRPAAGLLPASDRKVSFDFKVKRFLGGQDLSPVDAHLWWRIVLSESEKQSLYTSEMLEHFSPLPSVRHFHEVYERSTNADPLNRLLHIDSAVFLPDDLMIKNDRMSMAHSLEARVPFADHELTEFLASVPSGIKLPGLRKKDLMKRVMADRLPASILKKKKVGLEMPYSRWFKHELKDLLLDYCGPARIAATGRFRPGVIQTLIDDHLAGRHDNGRVLWGLTNFMIWHETFIQ